MFTERDQGVGIPSKHQYRTLQTFIEGRDNYSDYRQALTMVEPTVPLTG